MIYNVKDIAKKIIAQSNPDCGDLMTNMKLQKLLYYMQGFHLVFFDEPLFEDEIEAWMYGPVVPAVYEEYKAFGSAGLDLNSDEAVLSLNEEEEDMFNQVYEAYGQFSALKLMTMTHEETPWRLTHPGFGNVISKDRIKAYFSTQIES